MAAGAAAGGVEPAPDQVGLLTAGRMVLVQLAWENLEPRLAAWIGINYDAAEIVIGPALETSTTSVPSPC